MVEVIRIYANGGPEVLRSEDIELPPPGVGEARVRQTAIAINFSDINVRRGGFYKTEPVKFPLILGNEAAGVVETVGADAGDFRPGDRVAYAGTGGMFWESLGAYSEQRNLPASCLIPLPDDISDQQAAALLVKGLTASIIVNHIFRPQSGDTVLIHAAASGIGLFLSQWSKHLGATVIGTVGSPEKARIAEAHGCDHTILYREVDFVEAVKTLAPPGVSAVFDGVGKDTFVRSLDCVRPFGMVANYGNASGHVPPIDLMMLADKGSLSASRVGLFQHITNPKESCAELFDLVRRGILKVKIALLEEKNLMIYDE